jgi:hypothetical protein
MPVALCEVLASERFLVRTGAASRLMLLAEIRELHSIPVHELLQQFG